MRIFKTNLLMIYASCFFLTVFGIETQAQTDYIVKNDGSKVVGEMKTHSTKKVKFVAVGERKALSFKPTAISEAYKANHGLFRSVDLPGNKRRSFLQVLEDGKIKLYEYFKGGTPRTYSVPNSYGGPGFGFGGNGPMQNWYAQKDSGELVEVKSNQIWGSRRARKDNFSTLIADNPHVLDRYNKEDKLHLISYDRWLKSIINKETKVLLPEYLLTQFEVLKPFEVQKSSASLVCLVVKPVFGIQFQSPVGANRLIKGGINAPFKP